jgi:methylenetetrahydrofolate dehydrogenase (NADP+)/methenyltetrahydrofolate cyclohydrolase
VGLLKATAIAQPFLDEVREQVERLGGPIRLLGILGTDQRPSHTYSSYAAKGCAKVGIEYLVRECRPEQVSAEVFKANRDPDVHGVIVYYPIFGGARDRSLQNEVAPEKDVEGLHGSWTQRLYHDVREVGRAGKKAILPCTPLGIVKALEQIGVYDVAKGPHHQAEHLVATVFNRSEVVGRPLAALLAHDGARVYSFDINDVVRYERDEVERIEITRAEALAQSDVVITGVPHRDFPLVHAAEIKPGATCVNFSYVKNMADDVVEKAGHTLLRVGPITIAMLLRNTVRLYRNFHQGDGSSSIEELPPL